MASGFGFPAVVSLKAVSKVAGETDIQSAGDGASQDVDVELLLHKSG